MPRGIKTTEIDRAKEILQKEVSRIDVFQRLYANPDFEVFREELIEKKIDVLMDLMADCEDKDLARIRGQIEALRGIIKVFEMVIKRKEEVRNKLSELK